MAVVNLDVFPEIIVAFAFCPIGFALTYIMHFTAFGVTVIPAYYDLIWGPYIVIAVCAIISCIIMLVVKLKYQNYKFEHLYLVLIGLVFTLIAAISMALYEEHLNSRITTYAIAPGIGFVYVPALAYIHARAKDYRHFKISLCHLFYFIGFGLGTVIMNQYKPAERIKMLQIYGYILAVITIIAIGLIIANEVLQFRYKTYFNYKLSSDYNMDYENKFKTIFLKSYFKNVAQNTDINLNNYKLNPFKLAGYMIYLVVIKLIGLVFFYYPMLYINFTIISETDLFYCYLISLIGLVASTVLLKFVKIKINFMISLILKIISFLLLILFVNLYKVTDDELMIFYWIHSIFLLYGYNINDILVLELTKLKYTEVVLTIGLVLEILLNGALHLVAITSPQSIFNLNYDLDRRILEHIIPIVIVLLIVLFITILVMPKTHNNSVLEIQNIMFFKLYDKKGNGSGTSIQQKEQPMEYDARPLPSRFDNKPIMDDDERMYAPNSRFKPHHLQQVSMSSSTATSEFNYRNHPYDNDPYIQKPPVMQRSAPPPEEPAFDYNQVKPQPIFPRPRPTTNNFGPLYKN